MNLEFQPSDFLTVLVIAIYTSMAVTAFIKPALADYKEKDNYYNLAVNAGALVIGEIFAYLGLLAAGVEDITMAICVQTFFRGFSAFFLAVVGYKGYKSVYNYVSKDEPTE